MNRVKERNFDDRFEGSNKGLRMVPSADSNKGGAALIMNKPEKIKPGTRVGLLEVIKPTKERKGGYCVWLCRCDCGGEISLDTRCLQRGTVKSCGCTDTVKPGTKDLSGMRFGRLVCLHPTEERSKDGCVLWYCRCDCGNTCLATVRQLQAGNKKSCGCLAHPPLKDYVGKRFGRLTVIEYAGKEKGLHRWKCRCDCGNVILAGQTRLQSGQTKSCGCHLRVQHGPKAEKTSGIVHGTSVPMLRARLEKPPIASNTSGYNGVYRNSNGGWSAQITFKGKTRYIGSYKKFEEAVAARKKANQIFEDFIHWYKTKKDKNDYFK